MFESIKERYLKRLEKRTVISELRGEKVYLSKGSIFKLLPFMGKRMKEWGQIYPAVDEETKEVNWINLTVGGWRNMVKLLLLMILLAMAYVQFSILLGDSKEYMDGSKYVIIDKVLFNKHCDTTAEITNYLEQENITEFENLVQNTGG